MWRTRLLLEGGGVRVDASLFPVRPFDDWLGEALTESGFFAFERPGPDRPISSWFLVAAPRNPIFQAWWTELCRFWARPRRLVPGTPADPAACVSPAQAAESDETPYFWFHYLFQYLLETDPEFAARWNRCAKYPADDPHRLRFLFRDDPAPSESAITAALRSAPVHKLDWRATYPLELLEALA
jgi:hypothetical protein